MAFAKATRRRAYIKMALTGPSGSGKTYGALLVAFGLAGEGGRVAVLDTENGSASLYAHLGDYDVQELSAPFTPQRYIQVIQEAEAAGYAVLVIDSLSHAWAGEGGLLSQKEALDARGGNSFANWAKVTPLQEQLKSALLQSGIHILATMRSKQDYVLDQGDGRKVAPVKVGLAPIQRDGMEYEFSTVFDVSMAHEAITSKDRTGLFDGVVGKLSCEHGRQIRQWLAGASEESAGGDRAPSAPTHPTPAEPQSARTRRPGGYMPAFPARRTSGPIVGAPPIAAEATTTALMIAFATEAKRLGWGAQIEEEGPEPRKPSRAKLIRLANESLGRLPSDQRATPFPTDAEWAQATECLAGYTQAMGTLEAPKAPTDAPSENGSNARSDYDPRRASASYDPFAEDEEEEDE